MNRKRLILLFLIFFPISIFAQDFVWQVGIHSFFNNNEFSGSSVKNSQTMAGVRFAPQIGFSYDEKHRAFVGIDALHEFGRLKAVDDFAPIAYYNFDGEQFVFYMGAFPRKPLLNDYPRMFFQDSVNNYRPVMNGLFWEYRTKKDNHINVWLDWTGRQTHKNRETFFMGWSGKYSHGIFYGKQFGYMFHFAKTMSPLASEHVNDNGLILTSVGIDFAEKTGFEKLEINVGWSVGFERDRGTTDGWQNPNGFLSELKVEYRNIGLFNTVYLGQRQQIRYNLHKNNLYWGDQTYRLSKYNRTDFYYSFIKNRAVNVKLIYSLHFHEQKMFHEQSLYAIFDLDNLSGKK